MNNVNLKQRYWIFGIDLYYPCGGLSDVQYTTDSIEDAKKQASFMSGDTPSEEYTYDFVSIFDAIDREYINL
jgi:hypothetical protein